MDFLFGKGMDIAILSSYILPYDTIQNEIPEEAISILSTLSIQESSENTDWDIRRESTFHVLVCLDRLPPRLSEKPVSNDWFFVI